MSSELEYLKELHARLSEKIKALEADAVKKLPKVAPTPAQQLRTILVGPPGAGMAVPPYLFSFVPAR
jgi:adenylate kinase